MGIPTGLPPRPTITSLDQIIPLKVINLELAQGTISSPHSILTYVTLYLVPWDFKIYAHDGGGWFQVCLWPDSNGENSLIGIGKNFIGLRTATKQIYVYITSLGLQHLKMEIRLCCKLIFEHIFHFIAQSSLNIFLIG